MELQEFRVVNYRGIRNANLSLLGKFNVLIGRNNAGKSSLMAAIDAFFTAINGGDPVNIKPPIEKLLDFYESNANAPIELSADIKLSLADRDILVRELVSEYPQMQNALDGIDVSLTANVTVTFMYETGASTSYVSSITLRPSNAERSPNDRRDGPNGRRF